MKLKKIALGVIAGLGLAIFNTAQAEIIVHSFSGLNDADLCSNVAGHWEGTGKVKYGLTCEYTGTADVKSSGQNLDMEVALKRKSGPILCPDETLHLSGICKNGTIIIKNDHADLHGDLKETGDLYKVTMDGTVRYLVFNLGVNIDLKKPKK